jgi:hypothetical protein
VLLIAGCGRTPAESADPSGATGPGPAASASIAEGPAPTPFTVGSRPEPAAAAAAVLDAPSDAARRDAILAIFAGVGIGVYTPNGAPMVVGAERSPDDFFAYDFQIDRLAAAVRDGDRTSLADVVEDLAGAGFTEDGSAFSAERIAASVRAAIATVGGDSDAPTGYGIQVVHALTLNRPDGIDLSVAIDASTVRLDALAAFLLADDITLPSLDAAPAPTSLVGHLASINAAPGVPLAASAACGSIGSLATATRSIGQTAHELVRRGLGPGTDVSPYLHSVLMHAAVEATMTSSNGWHHFHRDTGNTGIAAFQLSLRLRVRPTQQAIDCGLLAGVTLPPEGPISEAPVTWDDAQLRRHGTNDCPTWGCQATDNEGLANPGAHAEHRAWPWWRWA